MLVIIIAVDRCRSNSESVPVHGLQHLGRGHSTCLWHGVCVVELLVRKVDRKVFLSMRVVQRDHITKRNTALLWYGMGCRLQDLMEVIGSFLYEQLVVVAALHEV